jgi:hypothetical protein
VALDATGNALAIAPALEPHVARVLVATRTELRAITEAKVKTDRRDARTLMRLLGGCWLPDGMGPRARCAGAWPAARNVILPDHGQPGPTPA